MEASLRVAYLSLQEVAEGLDSWAAVNEVIVGLEAAGMIVDRWFPRYGPAGAPAPLARLVEMARLQRHLTGQLSRYDALYVRGHPLALPAAAAAQRAGVPVVQECNGTYADLYLAWPQTRVFAWLFNAAQRRQYAIADRVVCVTPELAEWVRSEAPSARTEVVPNGVNTDVFCLDAPRFPGLPERYAVFFGNFAPWQGIEVLIDAFESAEWPRDLPLVFAGDGALTREVEAARDRSPDRLHYLGHVPYLDMASVVANATVSVVPIHSPERSATGFSPLKLYESMACGTPVVVSDVGGLAEFVRRTGSGAVFPSGDAGGLARAVAKVVGSPGALISAAGAARATACSECSWGARAMERARILREVRGAAARPE